ncbi:hypothetical protein AZE42_05807 [Rhizopogon vesiculosus]|uniref:Uncharacterized protein n=1 Tax=Rhizopogon vesiculosus TaxID=180088 RepID=A0A1J8QES7_9AGAM|nr:hypothetical protein AZE42_05807 [Rhizopogon vesiculosus]
MTASDASADVRKVGAKIINAHKAILPDRIESSLQAQKTSGKRTQRQAHPLSSELPRDIRAVRLIAVSKKATSTRQGVIPPRSEPASSSMQNKRRDVVCPSTSTSLRPQCVGNTMKARDGKPHVSGGGLRVQAPPPKPSGTQIRKTAVATRTHSVTSVRPLSRTGPRPFAKAEHPTMRDTSSQIRQSGSRGSSTEVERQTLSQASCRSITASRSGQQAMGQKKPVWGGRPVTKGSKPIVKAVSNKAVASGEPPQADTPHVEGVSHPCIDTTASTRDVKNQDSHSASPQAHTSPISSIEGGFLCSPPHVPQVARRRSNRLPRTPRRPRRESIYMELPESPGGCIDDTPSSGDRPVVSCIQHDVPVPRDASRLSYIEIGRARNAKFQVFVDANPEDTNTALVDRPSYMVDSLQGDATPPPLPAEAQPEAPHVLSASSPLNIQDLARSSSSPKGVSTIHVYRARGLRRFDYTPELSLLMEVSFVSEA